MVKEISAADLEAACRKRLHLEVSDSKILSRILGQMGLPYTLHSDTEADIFSQPDITELTLALAKEGCKVLSLQEKDESLESYYIRLIGGGQNE